MVRYIMRDSIVRAGEVGALQIATSDFEQRVIRLQCRRVPSRGDQGGLSNHFRKSTSSP
jgi:hypothetical protein